MKKIPPIEIAKVTSGKYIGHWYNIESVNAHHEAIKKELVDISSELYGYITLPIHKKLVDRILKLNEDIGQVKK